MVAPLIEEAYQGNDFRSVLDYINILPEGSTIRTMEILRYNKKLPSPSRPSVATENKIN